MPWDVFISHASEDKVELAKPLASLLKEMGLKVWYDEFVLRLGDPLRRSIERGLTESRYGVVLLSANFFRKEWPQRELDGLLALEAERGLLLPVWHELSVADVRRFSPILADRVGISTSEGLVPVAEAIFGKVRGYSPDDKALESFARHGVQLARELNRISFALEGDELFVDLTRRSLSYLFPSELSYERGPTSGRFVFRLRPIGGAWGHVYSRYAVDYLFVLALNEEPRLSDVEKFGTFLQSRSCKFGIITCAVFPRQASRSLNYRKMLLREQGYFIFFLGKNFCCRLLRTRLQAVRDDVFLERLKKVELDILHGR